MINDTQKSPVKAVFFDCDGTLIDTIPFVVASKQHSFANMGREVPPPDELIASIGLPISEDIANYFVGDDQKRYLTIYETFQREHVKQQIAVFSEAYRTVAALWRMGIPLGIVTSRRRKSTIEILELFHMKQFFTVMVNAGDTKLSKPHGDPLLEGIRRLNETGILEEEIKAENCVYIGDAHHDVGTAHAAGAQAVLVEWTAMPERVLEDLEYEARLRTHGQLLRDLDLL